MPSEIHSFAYCPRKYFFDRYIGSKRSIEDRIRFLWGKFFHVIKSFRDLLKGYTREKKLRRKIGQVSFVGRPDSYKIYNDKIIIIERKSGKAPRKGVWISDSLQVTAYGFILSNIKDNIIIKIEYRDKSRESTLDSQKIANLLQIVSDLIEVKYYGIVPAAKRSPRRCSKCPYSELCYALDKALSLEGESVYEPGFSIKNINIDYSFIENSEKKKQEVK